MLRTGRRGSPLLVGGCLLAVTACGPGSSVGPAPDPSASSSQLAADCRAAVNGLLATTQRYLDSIDSTTPAATAAPAADASPEPDPEAAQREFDTAFADVRRFAADRGCEQQQFRDDLATGLAALAAGGPVASAVLLQLRVQSGDRPPPGPVPPGGDVAAAVAAAAPDGVVELAAGEHVLPETLVLLRGVTLRGAGRDTTALRSAAPGGVLLVLTGEPVTVDALTLALSGDRPGSVLTAAPAATLAVTGARVTGARADAEGAGGIGVLLAAGAAGQDGPTRRTSLRMTDTEVTGNAVAGVVVGGDHRAELVRPVLADDGQCGVCFLARSDGSVTDGRWTGGAVAVIAAGDARPAVTGGTVTGGEIGVQAGERSAPVVQGLTVSGAARAAFLFTGSSRGAVRGSTCDGVPFGVVVGPGAAPELDGNTGCEPARGQE